MFDALDFGTHHDFSALETPRATSPALVSRVVGPGVWHAAMADFDDAVQEQLHVFAAATGRYAAIEPVLFFRAGEPVGGALIGIRRAASGLVSVAALKWGPMLRRSLAPDAPEIFAGMVDAIATEYGDRRGMMLSVLTQPSPEASTMRTSALHARGFVDGSIWEYPVTYMLNLRQSDEAMRSNLGARWRGHLNRSMRAELVFELGGPDSLPAFDRLYREMKERKKFDDLSDYHTMPALMGIVDKRLRPQVFFARRDGEIVAGAVVFHTGTRAVYTYGASSAAALEVNAGHFLHWSIARWLRDNTQASYYDLGFTGGVEGLRNFKSGLIGKNGLTVTVPLSTIYAASPLARALFAAGFGLRRLRSMAKERIDRLLGRALKPSKRDQA